MTKIITSSGSTIPMTDAELTVVVERAHQRRSGFTAEHDDLHTKGELLDAASCLIRIVAKGMVDDIRKCNTLYEQKATESAMDGLWPWKEMAKVVDEQQCLTDAAALIIAEKERRGRAPKIANKDIPRIVGVALLFKQTGAIFAMPLPNTFDDVRALVTLNGASLTQPYIAGYMTSAGQFVPVSKAKAVADLAGQEWPVKQMPILPSPPTNF